MVLFSHSPSRRRAIALAATVSVAAASFALAQHPMRADQVRGAMPVQSVAEIFRRLSAIFAQAAGCAFG